jgi:putative dehydrogenase
MNPIVSILAQGSMGAATAQRLTENGVEVRTLLAGRSAASVERAGKAGMKGVSEDGFADADFIFSIVPPAEAISLAKQLAPLLTRAKKKPVFVDLNAINPDTAMMVAMIIQATGTTFVDGGIIGGPPRQGYSPVYYVSGDEAAKVKALEPFGIRIGVLDAPGCAASALKMSYAGITKGLIALGSSMILAATRAGIAEALYAELSESQSTVFAGFSKSIPDMFAKAYRWVGEMEQISAFTGPSGPEHDLYAAVAKFYDRLGKDYAGPQAEIENLRAFFSPTKEG